MEIVSFCRAVNLAGEESAIQRCALDSNSQETGIREASIYILAQSPILGLRENVEAGLIGYPLKSIHTALASFRDCQV